MTVVLVAWVHLVLEVDTCIVLAPCSFSTACNAVDSCLRCCFSGCCAVCGVAAIAEYAICRLCISYEALAGQVCRVCSQSTISLSGSSEQQQGSCRFCALHHACAGMLLFGSIYAP
jgi:hypothetical protein